MTPSPENDLSQATQRVKKLRNLNVHANIDSFAVGLLGSQDVIHHNLAFQPEFNVLLALTGIAVIDLIGTNLARRRVSREANEYLDRATNRINRRDEFLDRP